MRKEVLEIITDKIKKEYESICYEIHKNTKDIKRLAEKQRILKECRHEYHVLLNQLGVWRADK